MQTTSVIGLPLARTDYRRAVEWIFERARQQVRPVAVEAANTHVAALARHDPAFRQSIEQFDLIVPDGMPLVWAMNLQLAEKERLRDRVYGPTLMLETIKASSGDDSLRHFFLGGTPETLRKLETNLADKFPTANLVGSYSPPFGEWPDDEFERITEKIRSSRANLIWVGLGCPKQEHWIANHKADLPDGVYFGIGAAFAFHAGEIAQAPAILQKFGLEWLFRIVKEPRRLLKRYLIHNFLFLWYLLYDHATASD